MPCSASASFLWGGSCQCLSQHPQHSSRAGGAARSAPGVAALYPHTKNLAAVAPVPTEDQYVGPRALTTGKGGAQPPACMPARPTTARPHCLLQKRPCPHADQTLPQIYAEEPVTRGPTLLLSPASWLVTHPISNLGPDIGFAQFKPHLGKAGRVCVNPALRAAGGCWVSVTLPLPKATGDTAAAAPANMAPQLDFQVGRQQRLAQRRGVGAARWEACGGAADPMTGPGGCGERGVAPRVCGFEVGVAPGQEQAWGASDQPALVRGALEPHSSRALQLLGPGAQCWRLRALRSLSRARRPPRPAPPAAAVGVVWRAARHPAPRAAGQVWAADQEAVRL